MSTWPNQAELELAAQRLAQDIHQTRPLVTHIADYLCQLLRLPSGEWVTLTPVRFPKYYIEISSTPHFRYDGYELSSSEPPAPPAVIAQAALDLAHGDLLADIIRTMRLQSLSTIGGIQLEAAAAMLAAGLKGVGITQEAPHA